MAKVNNMQNKWFRERPLLTLPQILTLLGIIAALFIALDLNRRSQAGELVGIDEGLLDSEISLETTRQIELQATLEYVQSDDYIAAYARDEGGYLLPGEKRVVPLLLESAAQPTPIPTAIAPSREQPYPWQAWWRLLTDVPLPSN